jgi:hypothetical protein
LVEARPAARRKNSHRGRRFRHLLPQQGRAFDGRQFEADAQPHSDAVFDYGPGAPHCFSGTRPDWADDAYISVTLRILPEMAKHITATAPTGADVKSWKY